MKLKFHVLILTLFLFLIAALLMPKLTFLLSDVGLRFLQVRELIDSNWQTFAINYKAQPFDPELAHVPLYYAYSVIDGEIFLNITPFLPLLASWFYALLGPIGLAVVPIAGTVLTAVAVFKLADITELPRASWLFWLTAIATPMFFYTFELWDHTLAAACAAWAIYGLSSAIIKQKLLPAFWGGIILGIGLGQRPEMYVFAIAVGVACLVISWPRWRVTAVLIGGSFLGVLPLWILQYLWVGNPLGMALATNLFDYGRPESYAFDSGVIGFSRPVTIGRFLMFIRPGDPTTFVAALSILFGFITIFMSLRQEKWRTSRNLYVGLLFLMIGYGIYVILALQTSALVGLITTFPLLVLSLTFVPKSVDNGRYRSIYHLVFLAAGLFLLMMLILWPASGGLQWGSRYLLPVIPLLVYLAAYGINVFSQVVDGKTQQAFRRLTVGLLCMMVFIQCSGLKVQLDLHQEAQQIQNFVENLPSEIILTNAPFSPAHLSGIDNKTFIYVADENDLEQMVTRLANDNIQRIAVFPLEFVPLSVPERIENITLQKVQTNVYELEKTK